MSMRGNIFRSPEREEPASVLCQPLIGLSTGCSSMLRSLTLVGILEGNPTATYCRFRCRDHTVVLVVFYLA